MELLFQKVLHAKFGEGEIVAVENNKERITVQFLDRKCCFVFPDAFERFLQAKDPALQSEILQLIKDQNPILPDPPPSLDPPIIVLPPETSTEPLGGVQTYLVFQGGTFDQECSGGYLWAPKYGGGNRQFHYWKSMLEVNKGDIIFHMDHGLIRAISFAKGRCYDCIKPPELDIKDLWSTNGRKLDCIYHVLNYPLMANKFQAEKIKYCSGLKYMPFNVHGSGNYGYLFHLPFKLAQIFASDIVMKNPYMKSLDSLTCLLSDQND